MRRTADYGGTYVRRTAGMALVGTRYDVTQTCCMVLVVMVAQRVAFNAVALALAAAYGCVWLRG